MFQLNTFLFWLFSKEKILLFTKHMRIQSRSYNKNKRSFSINPFAPSFFENQKDFFQVWICSFGIWALLLHFYLFISFFYYYFIIIIFPSLFFFYFFFYSLPSFLKSHRFDPVESDPFSHWAKGKIDFSIKSTMWNLRFFPLSLSLSHRYSVWINKEPFLLYLYESILLHSDSFPAPPKENPELDPKLTG